MGFFKDVEIDVIDMFHSDGMKETEIATSLGISLTQVHEILAEKLSVMMNCSLIQMKLIITRSITNG